MYFLIKKRKEGEIKGKEGRGRKKGEGEGRKYKEADEWKSDFSPATHHQGWKDFIRTSPGVHQEPVHGGTPWPEALTLEVFSLYS